MTCTPRDSGIKVLWSLHFAMFIFFVLSMCIDKYQDIHLPVSTFTDIAAVVSSGTKARWTGDRCWDLAILPWLASSGEGGMTGGCVNVERLVFVYAPLVYGWFGADLSFGGDRLSTRSRKTATSLLQAVFICSRSSWFSPKIEYTSDPAFVVVVIGVTLRSHSQKAKSNRACYYRDS